jgi:hypothetical protein
LDELKRARIEHSWQQPFLASPLECIFECGNNIRKAFYGERESVFARLPLPVIVFEISPGREHWFIMKFHEFDANISEPSGTSVMVIGSGILDP